MVNIEPTGDVIVSSLPEENFFAIRILEHGSVIETISADNGKITLPSDAFVGALENHLSLVLIRDSVEFMGTISFLPMSDEVPFGMEGFIDQYGEFNPNTIWACTDFVSVEDVADLVLTARARYSARALVAYDENREFVKVILGNSQFTGRHVTPDGSYSFVRASSLKAEEHSLMLYYRRRH